THTTEIHVLNGATNFQTFLEHTGTGLHETGDEASLSLQDFNHDGKLDLVYIKKYSTGTGSTEIHVLDGASRYQNFIVHTGTVLPATGTDGEFQWGDYNRDGVLDLFYIKKSVTGSGHTEVHVLDGKSNFQRFSLQAASFLGEFGDDADFAIGDF